MLRDDPRHDNDKGAGRSANLNFGSAQCRHDEPADDRRIDAGLRSDSGRDTEAMANGKATSPTVMPERISGSGRGANNREG